MLSFLEKLHVDCELNDEFLKFNARDEPLKSLIKSTPTTSERIQAIIHASYKRFVTDAEDELEIFGLSYQQSQSYTLKIIEALTYREKYNPDDLTSFGAQQQLPIKFSRQNYLETVQYCVLPELLIHFQMESFNLTYQQAT